MRRRAGCARGLHSCAPEAPRARGRAPERARASAGGVSRKRCVECDSCLLLPPSAPTFASSYRAAECATFVDTLFTAVRTKSYLPYSDTAPSTSASLAYASSSSSADAGIPIPLDGLVGSQSTSPDRGRKRGHDQDDYDSHGPSKGARLNQDGQFSRYGGRGDNRTSWAGRGDRGARMDMNGARADFMDGGLTGMGMGMNGGGGGMGMNGRGGQNYRPPEQRRGICRDYHSALLYASPLSCCSRPDLPMQIMATVPAARSASTATARMRSSRRNCSPWAEAGCHSCP